MAKWLDICSLTGWKRLGDIPETADPERPGWTIPSSWHHQTGVESGAYSVARAAELCRRSEDHARRYVIPEAVKAGVMQVWNDRPLGIAFKEAEFVAWFRGEYRPDANKNKTRHLVANTLVMSHDAENT